MQQSLTRTARNSQHELPPTDLRPRTSTNVERALQIDQNMQNKPKLYNPITIISTYPKRTYNNSRSFDLPENKPKTNPKLKQVKPSLIPYCKNTYINFHPFSPTKTNPNKPKTNPTSKTPRDGKIGKKKTRKKVEKSQEKQQKRQEKTQKNARVNHRFARIKNYRSGGFHREKLPPRDRGQMAGGR